MINTWSSSFLQMFSSSWRFDPQVSRNRLLASCPLYRSSSTSTVRLDDSTVTRPDPKSTVRALSHAVYLQIKNRDRYCPNTFMPEIFDERVHPVQVRCGRVCGMRRDFFAPRMCFVKYIIFYNDYEVGTGSLGQ